MRILQHNLVDRRCDIVTFREGWTESTIHMPLSKIFLESVVSKSGDLVLQPTPDSLGHPLFCGRWLRLEVYEASKLSKPVKDLKLRFFREPRAGKIFIVRPHYGVIYMMEHFLSHKDDSPDDPTPSHFKASFQDRRPSEHLPPPQFDPNSLRVVILAESKEAEGESEEAETQLLTFRCNKPLFMTSQLDLRPVSVSDEVLSGAKSSSLLLEESEGIVTMRANVKLAEQLIDFAAEVSDYSLSEVFQLLLSGRSNDSDTMARVTALLGDRYSAFLSLKSLLQELNLQMHAAAIGLSSSASKFDLLPDWKVYDVQCRVVRRIALTRPSDLASVLCTFSLSVEDNVDNVLMTPPFAVAQHFIHLYELVKGNHYQSSVANDLILELWNCFLMCLEDLSERQLSMDVTSESPVVLPSLNFVRLCVIPIACHLHLVRDDVPRCLFDFLRHLLGIDPESHQTPDRLLTQDLVTDLVKEGLSNWDVEQVLIWYRLSESFMKQCGGDDFVEELEGRVMRLTRCLGLTKIAFHASMEWRKQYCLSKNLGSAISTPLGIGSAGAVSKHSYCGEYVAKKTFRVSRNSASWGEVTLFESMVNEIRAGMEFDHPNLLKYYGWTMDSDTQVVQTENGFFVDGLYSVSEWLEGVNFDDWREDDPREFLCCLVGFASGLVHMHSKHWVHGSVHGENLMVTTIGSRVIDFENSSKLKEGESPFYDVLRFGQLLQQLDTSGRVPAGVDLSYFSNRSNLQLKELSMREVEEELLQELSSIHVE